MKRTRVHGWAVIFTVTLLLAACAAHQAEVAETSLMSGPDATMVQLEEQKQILERQENAVLVSRAWLAERERQLSEREDGLERRENAVTVAQAWLGERQLQLDERAFDLERKENAVTVAQSWLDERELQLQQRESGLEQLASMPLATEPGRCYASIAIPASYRTVAVTKPIDYLEGDMTMPTRYETISEQVLVAPARTEWTEILCEGDMTPRTVRAVQQALYDAGFAPGPIDGIYGPLTTDALNAFQKEHHLTVARHLTMETVEALGLAF